MPNLLIISQIQSNGGVENHIKNVCRAFANNGVSCTIAAKFANPIIIERLFSQSSIGSKEPNILLTPFYRKKESLRGAILFSLILWPFRLGFRQFDCLYTIELSWLTTFYRWIFLKKGGLLIWNPVGSPNDIHSVFQQRGEKFLRRGVIGKIILESVIHRDVGHLAKYQASIEVIPHLSNVEIVCDLIKQPLAGRAFRLAFLGRIDHNKGAIRLFHLFAQIKSSDIHLTYYGAGPNMAELQGLIKEKGLHEQVLLRPGWNDLEELAAIHQQIDLVVLPSHSEGLPLTLIECLGFGTPFLATDVGAIRTLEIPGHTKVVANNDHSLQEALPAFIAHIRKNGVDRQVLFDKFNQDFSSQVLVGKYLQTLLPGHG